MSTSDVPLAQEMAEQNEQLHAERAAYTASNRESVLMSKAQEMDSHNQQLAMLLFKPRSAVERAGLRRRLKEKRNEWKEDPDVVPDDIVRGSRILKDDYKKTMSAMVPLPEQVRLNLIFVNAIDAPPREVASVQQVGPVTGRRITLADPNAVLLNAHLEPVLYE
ncbi:hypothetical protein IE81DRAFT_353440 [Ceraceosorus guamensis]|uniref:Uncharacterized protein n=1 Tax=Ceraceosorus guamensis TaxID=1522189 RepID=A0A316VN72_9BASI|nr:hypothetical protein IE81DRAFT_353440 [Ceraceosorus guamensis]PWN39079.1 hypothetical protein IE81DRAFT_353440 [Ceraceosorus guamensis]